MRSCPTDRRWSASAIRTASCGSSADRRDNQCRHGAGCRRNSGEGGLLGIALSPNFATDAYVYAYLTSATDNRIVRMTYRDGTLGAPSPVFTGIPKAGIHNGGRIAFGPDGMLYATAGDASQKDRAQDLDYLGGKVLRMTPDGQPAPGNPFPGSVVYTLGHRNPQGLAWGPDGSLYEAEFGQSTEDELNLLQAGPKLRLARLSRARSARMTPSSPVHC